MSKIQRTNEEKQKLVSEFKESGLSKVQWCQNNNIPISTFNGWLFPKKQNSKNKCKFVEINISTEESDKSKTEPITIEYKDFKINILQNIDAVVLTEILKGVIQANV